MSPSSSHTTVASSAPSPYSRDSSRGPGWRRPNAVSSARSRTRSVSIAAIIRIAGGLFPSALAAAAPVLVALASVGCLSAALVAVAREDGQGIVRTIATSRLELVALGLFTATAASIAGAVLLVIAVALSAAATLVVLAAPFPHAVALGAAGAPPRRDPPPPPQTVSALTGQGRQIEGTGTMRFSPDVTVKLMFPDHKPPVQILTTYDMLKGRVGIDSGGYWTGPIMLDLDLPHQRITLHFPKQAPIVLEKASGQ